MYIFILTAILIGVSLVIMGINTIFRKKKFPESHIGRNKNMKNIGIVCAKSMDKIEQNKIKKELRYKNIFMIKQ